MGRIATIILAGCLAVAGCAGPRSLFDEQQQTAARVPGFPAVRAFADDLSNVRKPVFASLGIQKHRNILAMSGGGADGAFGAGVLTGWSETGLRPNFDVVSGVSTGALMAPLAFVGPEYDPLLREIYTGGYGAELVRSASVASGLFAGGLVSNEALERLISRFTDESLLREVAAKHHTGGRLFVVTTNLDVQRPVLWDMGAIAAKGGPESLSLFRRVLMASMSFPGVFAPVLIDVEANGKRFQEMHIDGSMTEQIFIPFGPDHPAGKERNVNLYVLINTQLEPSFELADNSPLQVSGRALWTMSKRERQRSVTRAYEVARRKGFSFKIAYVDNALPNQGSTLFDTSYMQVLYAYGFKAGRTSTAWRDRPPSL
jgi:predicted acylesterase/phospholipase RssA